MDFILLLASGNSNPWMSSTVPSTCSLIVRFPFAAERFLVSQSGRDEEEPAAAPLTVYTLTAVGSATIFLYDTQGQDMELPFLDNWLTGY